MKPAQWRGMKNTQTLEVTELERELTHLLCGQLVRNPNKTSDIYRLVNHVIAKTETMAGQEKVFYLRCLLAKFNQSQSINIDLH